MANTKMRGKKIAHKLVKPEEGVLFEVNFSEIDRSLFEQKRNNKREEITRQRIIQAFAKADENPKMYGKSFKTLIPKKNWEVITVGECIELASDLGGHIANNVEQALEWAQRISNGETWEELCNKPDTSNWPRLIEGDNGCIWVVGGARDENGLKQPRGFNADHCCIPASEVEECYVNLSKYDAKVPLIVI